MQRKIEHKGSAKAPNRIESLSPAKRGLLLGTVVVFLSMILFAVAELGVRTRMYVKYGTFWGFQTVKALDKDTGLYLPKPNYQAGPVKINSLGFRSPEIEIKKTDGTTRLAFLGGSTTFCQEVSSNDIVWPAVLTNSLQEHYPNRTFEHINASATAFTTIDSLANLNKRVAPLKPDVIFIYHGINDISHNGWFIADEQGIPIPSNPKPWLRKILNTSLLIDLVYKNIRVLSNNNTSNARQTMAYDHELIIAPFERDLHALVNRALEISPIVVIPTFTNQLRSDQTPERQIEAASTHLLHIPYLKIEDMVTALEGYNNVIRELASENVIVIETNDAIEGSTDNFIDSVHFTDSGSTKLGQYLAGELIKANRI